MPLALHKLTLTLFRNHEATRLDVAANGRAAPVVVLTGGNGAGKTNILEAISLLTPGRGLRGADSRDILRRAEPPSTEGWSVAAETEKADGDMARLGCGYDPRTDHKRLRVDGADVRASTAFAPHFSALWLTPQMDGLFADVAAARRRFIDRLVGSYAPDHAGRLNRYEKLQRERMAQLQTGRPDDRWLTPVEAQMACEAVAIAAARLIVTERLQSHARDLSQQQKLFPVPQVAMAGETEAALLTRPAVEVEERYAAILRSNRHEDTNRGRTTMGVHRSDLEVIYAAKNMPAAEASTGEQKALLIALMLAHAQLMRAEKGFVPVLLLDEVAAHLDDARRAQLFAHLRALQGQVFVTGTEGAVFESVAPDALFFNVAQGPGGVARLQNVATPGRGERA